MNVHTRQGIPLRPSTEAIGKAQMQALTRACIATAAAGLDRNVKAGGYIRDRWGDEAPAVETVLRAASAPATTYTSAWAKDYLATVTAAFLKNLVPYSAGADLLGRVLGLSFDGAATINLPTVTTPMADFVGEGAPIPVVQGVASQAVLAAYKFAVITVLSRETIESGNGEALVRDALLASTGPALDRRLFDANAAVANLRPAGLLNGITPLTPSTGGTGTNKTDAMQDDLQALLTAVAPVAGNSPIVLVAAPAQGVAVGLRTVGRFDYAILPSTQLAAKTVIAIAVNAIVSASGDAPEIDTTKAASLQMNDAPSGDLMTGGRVVATFQTDTIGLRLRWPLAWAVRDARGIAVMNNVNW
jgi:hypothetical protein